ncbi:MAG: 2-deoxy-D-gluconate 3-dehydrogenase [Phycisphaeraceae bacterium]|nr:2-deoxy-D-gluconate 3-dehydrogenase [Phycisphaeraceae bacterium]
MTTNLFDVTDKVVLITGGASGIGKAMAAAFVQSGAKAVIGSRTLEKVEGAVEELNKLNPGNEEGPVAAGVALDVCSENSVERAINKTMDLYGRLDVVINSAGIMVKKPTVELTAEEFNMVHETHVTGTLRVCQAAEKIFREQHDGSIINLASISSFVDLVQVTAYAAAKNAILGLTRSLANEWAKHGIRTNAIAPGFVPTDINRKMIEGTDRGRRIIEHTPMQRFGSGDEIAGAAVFLASPAAKFINGHTIVIDGGYLASGIGDSFAPWAPEEA